VPIAAFPDFEQAGAALRIESPAIGDVELGRACGNGRGESDAGEILAARLRMAPDRESDRVCNAWDGRFRRAADGNAASSRDTLSSLSPGSSLLLSRGGGCYLFHEKQGVEALAHFQI
jgi:hypothetical protein